MTKLTPEEDFALQSPETIAADIKESERVAIWTPLAKRLGWDWSAAHGGYINESHRNRPQPGWGSYDVAETSEDACFISGVETIEEAIAWLDAREPMTVEQAQAANRAAPAKMAVEF